MADKGQGIPLCSAQRKSSEPDPEIIRNTLSHADLPQEQVQVLIWALLVRSSSAIYHGDEGDSGSASLAKAELLEANGGALGLIPPSYSSAKYTRCLSRCRRLCARRRDCGRRWQSQARAFRHRGTGRSSLVGDRRWRTDSEGRWSRHPAVLRPVSAGGLSIDASRCLCASAPAWFRRELQGVPNSSSSVRQTVELETASNSISPAELRCPVTPTRSGWRHRTSRPIRDLSCPRPRPQRSRPQGAAHCVITAPARGDQEPRCITDVPKCRRSYVERG